MRRQSARFETQIFIYSFLSISLLYLSSCATGISSSDQYAPLNNVAGLQICDQKPAEGTDARLDERIKITIDALLDAGSVNEDNIQVYTIDGARFGGKILLDYEAVMADTTTPGCPQGQPVTRIVIKPGPGVSFLPGQTYKVIFRDRTAQNDSSSTTVLGIAAQGTGARLQQQVVTFKTVNEYANESNSRPVEVLAMTPGKILNRAGDGSNELLQDIVSNYFTFDKRANIQIAWNGYFRHTAWDVTADATTPIPPTPLYSANNPSGFIGVALGTVDSTKQLNALLAALPQTIENPAEWARVLQTQFYNQIPATVESSDRKILTIRPTQDYPDGIGRVTVVILQGFLGRNNRKPQKQQVYVGAFWNQGHYQQDIGMPDLKTILKRELFP